MKIQSWFYVFAVLFLFISLTFTVLRYEAADQEQLTIQTERVYVLIVDEDELLPRDLPQGTTTRFDGAAELVQWLEQSPAETANHLWGKGQ